MAISKPVATDAKVSARAKSPRRAAATQSPPMPATNRLAPGLVGARLRERRMARGISLRQFARDIDVSASFISQLETGKAQPSVATFFSICAALDISIDELFTDEESTDEPDTPTQVGLTDAANNQWSSPEKITGSQVPQRNEVRHASSPVVRPNERNVIVLDSGVTWESLTSSHHDKTDFMFVRYEVGGSSTLEDRLIRHAGVEYGFILSGTLQIALGFDTHILNAGDSISFDSSRPHRLYNVGDVAVEAIWVNMPFRGN